MTYIMCESYEIYKEKVGGKTFNGDLMKELNELPENIQKAWLAIDNHFERKINDFHKQIMTVCVDNFHKNNFKTERKENFILSIPKII